MQGSKSSFVVYCTQITALNDLSDAQIGKLIRYLVQFLQSGREPPKRESNALLVAFNLFKLQISIDLEKYEQSKERVKKWKRRKREETQETSDNVNVKNNVNVNVNDNGENKNNKIDFYSSLPNSEEEEKQEKQFKKLKSWWNTFFEGTPIPKLQRMTKERMQKYYDIGLKYKPEEIQEVCRRVRRSDYMQGRTKEHRLASFDFVFTEENFLKILEGEYR